VARTRTTAARRPERLARALASPIGVIITVPLLVVAVGAGILLIGRDATRTASLSLARHQLAEQAISVQEDVAFALDQADALIPRVRVLADETRPVDDILPRLHDLIVGRAGIAYISISFPDGAFRGAYLSPEKHYEVQESRLDSREVRRFAVENGALRLLHTEPNTYDPRTRSFYQLAARTGARTWTTPYTFFKSHETGITCTEPVLDGDKLLAVLTVDFNVGALSSFVARPALDQARSVVYTRDGTMLAYPSADQLKLPETDKLLRHEDLKDPALEALFAAHPPADGIQFVELGDTLASVAPIGGKRAGVEVPLDWYVATLVPASTLLGATHRLERSSIIASGGALAIAVGLALVLAWNLVRMRRQVAASREEARTAEARARELGSYRLVARLGAGGMGEVWRAEHRLLARTAAIKLIRPEALSEPSSVDEMRERFRREAQVLASMRSRHTIQIFDYGVTEAGVFYYVMEILDGLDLESLVVRYGAQPAARVIKLLEQACGSLAEAHDAGLLHRDIKPPNLFACRAADEVDICKLLDFGIVQTPGDAAIKPIALAPIPETPKLTQLGAMLGTPGFMAPEQILGMKLDGRADLYALGCVAWWLLAGNEVFSRDDGEAKILHKHIYDPAPSLRSVVRGWIPKELDDVIRSCLAKEVDDRPRDARALAEMLRAIEIPDEHRWTPARAAAWWTKYEPPKPVPSLPSGEVQVIMPGRAKEQRPLIATHEHAIGPTLAGPTAHDVQRGAGK
jgi:serine/threonine protein kinase